MMRRLFRAVLSLLAMQGVAAAADLPPPFYKPPLVPAAYTGWTGFYVGLNAGGGIGLDRSDFGIAIAPDFASINNPLPGAVGGVEAGYNWQTGMTVIGFEADFAASGLRGGISAPCPPGFCGLPLSATYSQKVPWFGTVRGRLGLASSGWLVYATAGYAYARLDIDAVATAGVATAAVSVQETRNGWTAGGGIEVALAPGWSGKVEYLYLDYGRASTTWIFPVLPPPTDGSRFTMSVARAGVNYRF
jgi:opacity protein-like surface antigen